MLTTMFEGRVRTYSFLAVNDGSASLLPVELADAALGPIVRAFVIDAPAGTMRGGHGHRRGSQLLVRLSGEIDIDLAHGGETATVVLDDRQNAVRIDAPVWSRQTYRGDSPRLAVFCDTPYDPDSYLDEPAPA